MPNPGSIVQLESGVYGIVTAVTPTGAGDSILCLGAAGSWEMTGVICVDRIHKVIYEPERDDGGVVLGRCPHGVDLDREFCSQGCRV